MTANRELGRAWAVFATALTTAACGAVWMASNRDDVQHGNGVSVSRETKSPREIREFWTPERIRRTEPAEMPVWIPCEHFPHSLSPDCW
ncbi:hypothetical protein QQM39_32385 [Streptomyces sp. DT2A-34]|uniref:hypothetical protein n=1 Tax=Streptomyces sp. DT2A-34 TaxID=3051182 RepID=UPI00265BBDFA|nr:hypothetical protein [Streptomyces sp. DT2A-34]MDO0915346.1 hypothetical protein [Streptomyces sp. DT2A-34]